MYQLKNTSIYIIIFFAFLSCNKKQETTIKVSFNDKFTLKKTNQYSFQLDTLSSYGSDCVQFFENNKTRYIAFYNGDVNAIYIYNFENKKNEYKIKLFTEGGNSVGRAKGFYIHNFDSIFVPSMERESLYILDIKGLVKKRIKYPKRTNDFVQLKFETNNMPIYENGFLYCPNLSEDHSTEILNIQKEIWEKATNFPDSYKNVFFASPHFYRCYRAYNEKKKLFCFSFPVEDFVYTSNNTKDIVAKHYAGGYNVVKVKPTGKLSFLSFSDSDLNFKKSYSYLSIIYDKYRDLYYRIMQHPISEENLNSNDQLKKSFKNTSIIILNSNLEKVGEYEVPKYTYGSSMIFVTKEGLNMVNFKKSKENEDYVFYDLFEVVEKKK